MKLTGGQIVVETLIREGVPYIVGIPPQLCKKFFCGCKTKVSGRYLLIGNVTIAYSNLLYDLLPVSLRKGRELGIVYLIGWNSNRQPL